MTISKGIIFTSIITFLCFVGKSQYTVTKNCELTWEAIMDLRFDDADSLIMVELNDNPTNYYATYLQQTSDAFRFMIAMSEEGYADICEKYNSRMEYLEGKDEDSPYYNACIAEMQLQVGMFNIIYGERLTGLRKAYGSYKKTYRNIEKFPEFNESYKLDGIFNVAISNMPPFVGWAVSFFGVSGSYIDGYRIMEEYYKRTDSIIGLRLEAVLYNILAFKLNKDPKTAYSFFDKLPIEYSEYKLLNYFKGNVAYRTGHNEEALEIISNMEIDENGYYFNGVNYLMGKILLRKLDTNCRGYLHTFLDNQKEGQYHKEINYQLALSFLIDGDLDGFEFFKSKSKESGNEITERDREAVCDYSKKYIPDANLIRAGLLLDGGYFYKAKYELEKVRTSIDSREIQYKLHYLFLLGQMEYEKGNDSKAITYFNDVIKLGKKENYSFASHASLLLANIYEKSNADEAYEYYKQAKDLWNSGYYDYIEEISVKKIKIYENR